MEIDLHALASSDKILLLSEVRESKTIFGYVKLKCSNICVELWRDCRIWTITEGKCLQEEKNWMNRATEAEDPRISSENSIWPVWLAHVNQNPVKMETGHLSILNSCPDQ